jgi:hypothetical protein
VQREERGFSIYTLQHRAKKGKIRERQGAGKGEEKLAQKDVPTIRRI